MFKKTCLKCGKEFLTRKKKQKYCSNKCYWESLKNKPPWNKGLRRVKLIKKRCVICGKEFLGKPNRVVCSRHCAGKLNAPKGADAIKKLLESSPLLREKRSEIGKTVGVKALSKPSSIAKSIMGKWGQRSGRPSKESIEKLLKVVKSPDFKEKLRRGREFHDEVSMNLYKVLTGLGYKCVVLVKRIPDLALVINDEIYGIEVGGGFRKYKDIDMRQYGFAGIIPVPKTTDIEVCRYIVEEYIKQRVHLDSSKGYKVNDRMKCPSCGGTMKRVEEQSVGPYSWEVWKCTLCGERWARA